MATSSRCSPPFHPSSSHPRSLSRTNDGHRQQPPSLPSLDRTPSDNQRQIRFFLSAEKKRPPSLIRHPSCFLAVLCSKSIRHPEIFVSGVPRATGERREEEQLDGRYLNDGHCPRVAELWQTYGTVEAIVSDKDGQGYRATCARERIRDGGMVVRAGRPGVVRKKGFFVSFFRPCFPLAFFSTAALSLSYRSFVLEQPSHALGSLF